MLILSEMGDSFGFHLVICMDCYIICMLKGHLYDAIKIYR